MREKKTSFLWKDQNFNPEWPKRAFINVDCDSVKYHFLHVALLKSRALWSRCHYINTLFILHAWLDIKRAQKRERKAAKRAMNWSRNHSYANKMTAVNFLFIHFEMFSLFCLFYFSSDLNLPSNKNIQTWSYEWGKKSEKGIYVWNCNVQGEAKNVYIYPFFLYANVFAFYSILFYDFLSFFHSLVSLHSFQLTYFVRTIKIKWLRMRFLLVFTHH